MARLAVFVRSFKGGGAQTMMLRLASGLAEAGYEVDLVVLQAKGDYAAQIDKRVRVVDLAAPRLLLSFFKLGAYLRRAAPQALLVTEAPSNIMLLLVKLVLAPFSKTRIVLREGLFASVALQQSQRWQIRLAYRLAKIFYRLAAGIIALTPAMAADLAKVALLPLKKITVIDVNPTITPQVLAMAAEPITHPVAARWLAEKATVPVVVATGRLARQKGFDVLVDAVRQVQVMQPVRLIIFGMGEEAANLDVQIKALSMTDKILLVEETHNPYRYMRQANVFVLPSRYEGLPNMLIEALAVGAPVVAADCPSGPAEILAGGKFGALVPVGDAAALAAAIIQTLQSPVSQTISQARGMEYTVEHSVRLYAPVLLGAR